MDFIPLSIPDVILIKPDVHRDERGFFFESWQKNKFAKAGIDQEFVQDNHSRSSKNVLRGLHYQIRQPQGKLIRAIVGEVFDVAVDLRRSSPSFGKWVSANLSSENFNMLWIPPGFAHGFLVLSDVAEFVYKATDFYAPQYERCILWNDRDLGIDWPISGHEPILSEKDSKGKLFREAEVYL
ncbi:MAG TPA: dTDP-4-dehydrorhamnose 3,5-epimerase [Flexilinea sp.]|jgi:dTDP-4-dehydrorhamnose 3,5-epimerase|nr:dTDP-4-dehydrorhamnose 3,5-epimerase [Flexilinea sp.]HNY93520.1 dTDP-4-dehydrorhamnose 3,5-epimerase [Flexilinea sp.]HOP01366.1 dTDP-4-dehydrorhamnose 3,5-epimerase [Flexilinea sp.]HPJ65500.1 dTDP-4-dehydrorhamnose 3,5-epimerase [Flexilinea sp.]HPL57649.1 dTDP-4-dehydrorhamnose 3,5-epimerase [Flexilinea sp.]